MNRNLYAVTLELEIVVAADNERHACEVARDTMNDWSFDEEPEPVSAQQLLRGSALPAGYGQDSIPWGIEDDRTIGELLAHQPEDEMAAKLRELCARLKRGEGKP